MTTAPPPALAWLVVPGADDRAHLFPEFGLRATCGVPWKVHARLARPEDERCPRCAERAKAVA